MWILHSFYHSLFDIAWLREQRGHLGRAVGYSIIFLVLIYTLRLIPISFFLVPKVLETAETEFIKNTPDFTATWKDAKLSVAGLPQPYTVEKSFDGQTIRFVVDTVSTSSPSIESLIKDKDRDGVLLITRDNFSFYNPEDKKINTESFVGMTDETVTKAGATSAITKFRSYGSWISMGLLTIGIIFLLVGKLIGLLVLGLLVYLVVRIRQFGWTYKEIFTTGLYATTLPTLIATTALWFGLPVAPFGTIAFFLLMYLVVSGFDTIEKKA